MENLNENVTEQQQNGGEQQPGEDAVKTGLYKMLVPLETAREEVVAWLDYKRVKPSVRMNNVRNIMKLVEAVMYSIITIDPDTKVITHKLEFPILNDKGGVFAEKLTYKPRLRMEDLSRAEAAEEGITNGIGAALTGQPAGVIGKLDSEDGAILASVGVFFIL
ncbi:MAG: hypothetical protein KF744_09090 [Taibaiella sp.]|nr:hypothetical protein [Taibaiella sp.]